MKSSAKRTNLVLIVVFVLFVIAGAGGMVPIGLKIKQLSSEKEAAKKKNDELETHLKDLQALEKQFKQIENEIAKVSNTLPADKAISELLNQVDNMFKKGAGGHSISLSSLTISGQPLDPKAKPVETSNKALTQTHKSGDFYEIPLTISGSGDFYTGLIVIDRINSMSRLMAVTSINMGSTQNGFVFTIGATAFLKP